MLLPTRPHFNFDALPQVRVAEAFARVEGSATATYAGVQWGSWLRDEVIWDERYGRFLAFNSGIFSFFRGVPDGLTVVGGASEPFDTTDALVRLTSGTPLVAKCGALYETEEIVGAEFRLYNAATGGALILVVPQQNGNYRAAFGTLANGSYLLWARFKSEVKIGDPGPGGDPAVTGLSRDEMAWGEWSAIRVRVGTGAWSLTAGKDVSPGCPLYRKTGNADTVLTTSNEATYRCAFDPLARTVSASFVTTAPVRHADGTIDVPAGSQIIAGLRASPSGPQSAVWVLKADLTTRLLGLSDSFSNGFCECAKADHHASDLGQDGDGNLYLLSECSLFRYDPDGALIASRIPGHPLATSGHPGGQCLRFSKDALTFWTENLTDGVDDGAALYNRLVRRVSGRDERGPGTLWHGPNCSEIFLGRQFGVRASEVPDKKGLFSDTALGILDTLDGGRWAGNDGISRPLKTTFWQRLAKCGANLFVFGYNPTTNTPLCHVATVQKLAPYDFPFFVRRATRCDTGTERLLLCARPQAQGIGIARRVVEVGALTDVDLGLKVCSLWNDGLGAYILDRAAWEARGHSVVELPAFLTWAPLAGSNGGGVWQGVSVEPTSGYWLTRDVTPTQVRFFAHAATIIGLENGSALLTEGGDMLVME